MDDSTPDAWLDRPPSLTGGHSDQNLPYFTGIDYLRLTVFAPVDAVIERIDEWLDRWEPSIVGRWEFVPAGGRVEGLYRSSQPGLEVEQSAEYAGVRLKGKACQAFGLDALLALLLCFDGFRWHCTRIDFAWDGFPLSTRRTFDLLKAGDVRTRATLDPHPVGDLDADPIDGKGSTVYTHCNPELRGIERYIRWYDMRGPVRCELVLKKKYAAAICSRLYEATPDTCGTIAMGALRGFVDLTDPADRETRMTRRRLLPEWESFVNNAEPWRLPAHKQRQVLVAIAGLTKYEVAFQRAARRLYEAMQAFGPEYVIGRIEHYGRDKASLTDIEHLKRVRAAAAANRVAGIPPWPDEYDAEVPI